MSINIYVKLLDNGFVDAFIIKSFLHISNNVIDDVLVQGRLKQNRKSLIALLFSDNDCIAPSFSGSTSQIMATSRKLTAFLCIN
uniref:Uncharacterized protein n=1 Tax=Romanomermis culicivorax TaxID=13658 RepID=A0A915IWL1_ROMCU